MDRAKQSFSALGINLSSRAQPFGDLAQPGAVEPGEELRGNAFHRIVCARAMRQTQRCAQRVLAAAQSLEKAIELAPVVAQRRVEDLLQAAFARLRYEIGDGSGARRVARSRTLQHTGARIGDQLARGLLVEHAERRRHAGLERKARQHVLAERVQRLDLQPARRLERLCEQSPGPAQIVRRCTNRFDVRGEFRIGQHRPASELIEQPPLHFGRCRLGIGQAKNLLGLGPCEQQTRHAIGERVRFSSTGIGRHPGGAARIGGGMAGVDAHSPLSSQPLSDHSRTRARWS